MALALPAERVASAFTPVWPQGGYIPYPPWPKQRVFLCLDHILDVGFGGAAGPGKSDALLMAALQYVNVPDYTAVLIRRTYSDLAAPGALMDRAEKWLRDTDATWNEQKHRWTFPSGARLAFGYLQHDRRMEELYDSTEFHYIGIDEATQMTERQFTYMFSRLRVVEEIAQYGVRPRFRSATNPGGVGHDFYAARYSLGEYADQPMDPDRAFLPGKLEDNPALNPEEYDRALLQMSDLVDYQRKRQGDWTARDRGDWFDRDMFLISDVAPRMVRQVRHWDWAATDEAEVKGTNKDPDWTVGLKAGIDEQGGLWILDVVRFRSNPSETDRKVRATAQRDGLEVEQSLEQEPGASGKRDVSYIRRNVLAGFTVHADVPSGDKKIRAKPVSSLVMSGEVHLLRGAWNADFFREVEAFPNPKVHDDQVDGLSGAYQKLSGKRRWGAA